MPRSSAHAPIAVFLPNHTEHLRRSAAVHVAPPPRAILHVGPHKTATTSVAQMLWRYRSHLGHDRVSLPNHLFVVNISGHISTGYKTPWSLAMHLQGQRVNATLWRVFTAWLRSQHQKPGIGTPP